MNYLDLVRQRYSVRAYRPDPVEKEKLDRVLEAAILAPTAANWQPFRIMVVQTKGREAELKRIYNKDWFVEAPYVLGICSIPEKGWVRRDGKSYSDVDAAIAMDHLVLAAADQGLGSCWIAAFDTLAAREVLSLDDSLEPIAFTPIGYAKEKVTPQKARKTAEELVVYL